MPQLQLCFKAKQPTLPVQTQSQAEEPEDIRPSPPADEVRGFECALPSENLQPQDDALVTETPQEEVEIEPEGPSAPQESQDLSPEAAEGPKDLSTADSDDALLASVALEAPHVLRSIDLKVESVKKARDMLEDNLGLERGALDFIKDAVTRILLQEVQRLMQPDTPIKKRKLTKRLGGGAKRRRAGKRLAEMDSEGEELVKAGSDEEVQADADEPDEEIDAPADAPESKGMFLKKAGKLKVEVGNELMELSAREFPSGTCGYYGTAWLPIVVNGVRRVMQCQVNCAVVGSREWQS